MPDSVVTSATRYAELVAAYPDIEWPDWPSVRDGPRMSPGELRDCMLNAGFTVDEVDRVAPGPRCTRPFSPPCQRSGCGRRPAIVDRGARAVLGAVYSLVFAFSVWSVIGFAVWALLTYLGARWLRPQRRPGGETHPPPLASRRAVSPPTQALLTPGSSRRATVAGGVRTSRGGSMRMIAVVVVSSDLIALGVGAVQASTPPSTPPPIGPATQDEAVAAFVVEFGDVWSYGSGLHLLQRRQRKLVLRRPGLSDEVFVAAYGYERNDVWAWVSVGRLSGRRAAIIPAYDHLGDLRRTAGAPGRPLPGARRIATTGG